MPPPYGDPISAFILAGGTSQRMGRDKASIPWGDQTLIEHMSEQLRTVADSVRIVGRDPLPDRQPGRGPVEGIATALTHTQTSDNLIVAVDLPLLNEPFLRYLALRQRTTLKSLLVCGTNARTPLCIGARLELLPSVDAYLESGGRSLQGLVENVEHDTIDADALRVNGVALTVFENINSPEDYDRVRNLAGI